VTLRPPCDLFSTGAAAIRRQLMLLLLDEVDRAFTEQEVLASVD
jgi:hypothetical protein